MDEQENETFDTSGALDKLRKVSSVFFLPYDLCYCPLETVEEGISNFIKQVNG